MMIEEEIFKWVALGVMAAFFAFDKARYYINKSKNGANDSECKKNKEVKRNGGPSQMLVNHEKRISVNEEGIKNICKSIDSWIEDNKEEHRIIFNKIDKIGDKLG